MKESDYKSPTSYTVTLFPALIEELNWISHFPDYYEHSRIKDYFPKEEIETCLEFLSTWSNYYLAQSLLEMCQEEWDSVDYYNPFVKSVIALIPRAIVGYIEVTVFG